MRVFQIQRWSAIALLVFVTIHMTVVHYPPFHIDYSRIIERMGQPLWKAIDVAFLFFVLLHALSGSYAVLMDFGGIARLKKALAASAVVLALVGFVYGTMTILAFQPPV
jgi:succinate dehydrogenase hydrophobic anchor subunit